MEFVFISGFFGFGKLVVFNFFEDLGYYCVDNLLVVMLMIFVLMLMENDIWKVVIVIDVCFGYGIDVLLEKLRKFVEYGVYFIFLFLYFYGEMLFKWYFELCWCYLLVIEGRMLEEVICCEQELFELIVGFGYCIDMSGMKLNGLCEWVCQFIEIEFGQGLMFIFEFFGFKYGLLFDVDFVFDVCCLFNLYYDNDFCLLIGCDQLVIDFFEVEDEVCCMCDDICCFVGNWLLVYICDNCSYLMVVIGCIGGQYCLVYIVEWLVCQFVE